MMFPEITIDTVSFEWFDDLWEDMIKFSKEHPQHIFIPADEPRERLAGWCAFWSHPPGCVLATDLGIDISDIRLEKYWTIKFVDFRKSVENNRTPIILNLQKRALTQVERLELARNIVKIAKET